MYAFETHAGPSEDDPGILLRSLMTRFEHCVGVGDAMRDASTAAKINGCVPDWSWEQHIRPFFEKVCEFMFPPPNPPNPNHNLVLSQYI
jgi:hypothetical protein